MSMEKLYMSEKPNHHSKIDKYYNTFFDKSQFIFKAYQDLFEQSQPLGNLGKSHKDFIVKSFFYLLDYNISLLKNNFLNEIGQNYDFASPILMLNFFDLPFRTILRPIRLPTPLCSTAPFKSANFLAVFPST